LSFVPPQLVFVGSVGTRLWWKRAGFL
jgi:hypothetical protein